VNDFLKWIAICFALFSMIVLIGQQGDRITVVETQVYDVCVSMQHLLKNRPTPKIHSYAKDLPICGEKRQP
jgi:hypothetical protein